MKAWESCHAAEFDLSWESLTGQEAHNVLCDLHVEDPKFYNEFRPEEPKLTDHDAVIADTNDSKLVQRNGELVSNNLFDSDSAVPFKAIIEHIDLNMEAPVVDDDGPTGPLGGLELQTDVESTTIEAVGDTLMDATPMGCDLLVMHDNWKICSVQRGTIMHH
ncbi:hypothetical protein BDQ17DRAFT_1332198 [Cyathus striatus]|nr:hypothetical protein BDQ17DRAFT_1332198 [Cyathus striatus]